MKAVPNQVDQAVALSFLGFDSMEDAHYWAMDNNELNRLDALIDLLANHREQAEEKVTARYAITDERVEAAAKALYEADDVWHTAFPWPDMNPDQPGSADTHRRLARAMLEAIDGNTA